MIEEKKLIEKIDLYIKSYSQPPYGREVEGTVELLEEIKDMLREQSSVDKWTPINNNKPPLGTALIVTVKNRLCGGKRELRYPVTYMEKYYENGYGFYMNGTEILLPDYSEVIAWKPLPEPWEGEE